MCKLLILTSVVILILFGSTYALDWNISISNTYQEGSETWLEPSGIKVTISADNDLIKSGWSTPFKFYGTGDVNLIGPGFYFVNPEFEDIWEMAASQTTESWDGDLTTPDQYNFSGISLSGYGTGLGQTELFTFYLNISKENCNINYMGDFCIDSGDFENDTYDWLFNPPVPFGGPYCWPVASIACGSLLDINCPSDTLKTIAGTEVSWDLNGDAGYSEYLTFSYNYGNLDTMTGVWTFTPSYEQTGRHLIDFRVEEYFCGCDAFCYAILEVFPECGDVNKNGAVNILDITFLISYVYLEGEAPEPLFIGDVNNNEAINLLDITHLIAFLYSSGPTVECNYGF